MNFRWLKFWRKEKPQNQVSAVEENAHSILQHIQNISERLNSIEERANLLIIILKDDKK